MRARYGAELEDLLGDRSLTLKTAVDLLRGALDAQLHPELAEPALATAGGGSMRAAPRAPRWSLATAVVILSGVILWGLSMPHPVVPIFLPVGAHASAEALAQALQPGLRIRATQQRDGAAAVLLASDGRSALVVSSRTPTLGWKDQGGGVSTGPGPSDEHPLTFSWTAGANSEFRFIAISGTTTAAVTRIELVFTDDTRETLPITDRAFLWFDARSGPPSLPSMANAPRGPAFVTSREQAVDTISWWRSSADGRLPAEIHAWSSSAALLDRISIGTRWVPIELLGAR